MSGTSLEITLNGKLMVLPHTMSLSELVTFLRVDSRTIALGRNAEVVPKSKFDVTLVSAGDRIDVVHFVAGG